MTGADASDAGIPAEKLAQHTLPEIEGDLPRTSDESDKDVQRADDAGRDPSPTYDVLKPQVHECNGHLLFAPFADDEGNMDGMAPYFAIVSAWEPDMDGAGPFGACGSRWDFDLPSDHQDEDEYGKSTNKYWDSSIATRDGDSGEFYLEYQIPVYDVDDEKRNRRINFQFRPSLPDARHFETGNQIQSLPEDLPEGVRVQVQASNVEPEEIIDILQAMMSEIGVQASYFARPAVHPWSKITGLAYYVRALRGAVDELVIGSNGVMERLAQFGQQREGRGEMKWDNGDVFGKRHAVVLDAQQLSALYGNHTVAKLLKSYLTNYASEEAGPPDTNPTDHPKIEVQYNRKYTDFNGHIGWFADDDDHDMGHAGLSKRLQEYLINALEWTGLPRRPDPDLYVADDHFEPRQIDDDLAADLEFVDDPIETAAEHERDVVTNELIDKTPTEKQKEILLTAADGGRFPNLDDLADAAGTSTSSASRCVRKFGRLFSRMEGLQLADDVVRDRISELLAGLEERLDSIHEGLDRLSSGTRTVDEDSALGQWAKRWGAQIRTDRLGTSREQLKIVISGGNLTERELLEILRRGYDAADMTSGADPVRFASSLVAYYDRDGEKVDVGEWVGVNQGGRTRIMGKLGVDALH